MTAKEFLSQAYWLDRRIDSKLSQIVALRNMVTKTNSVMNDSPFTHTRNVHSMQDTIAKIVDMEAEINADIDKLVDLKRLIMHTIKDVGSPEYQTLLELRYLCFWNWEKISMNMHYSRSQLFNLLPCALEEMERILAESEKTKRIIE